MKGNILNLMLRSILFFAFISLHSLNLYGSDSIKNDSEYKGLSPTSPLKPALTLKIQDASKLYKFFTKNPWFNQFKKTNLFRGLSDDIGPLYFLLGQNFNNAWEGRLIDFIMEQVLVSDPFLMHYYSHGNLVTPFGITIPKENEEKIKIASKILEKSAGEPVVQKMIVSSDQSDTFQVQPLTIHSHRLSYINQKKCAILSKDPRISASLSLGCDSLQSKEEAYDAKLRVDLGELFPQLSQFMLKFLKLTSEVDILFKYFPLDNHYKPYSVDWQLSSDFEIPSDTSMADIINFLPAHTMFFSTLNIPWPDKLSPESLTRLLETSLTQTKEISFKPVTLAAWRVPQWKNGVTHMTALIISDVSKKIDLIDIPQLFSAKTPVEIKFDRVCEKYVVITPYIEVLTELWENCSQRKPVLNHKIPRFFSAAASSSSLKGLLYFNLATLLVDSFEIGTIKLQEKIGDPPEIEESLQILSAAPVYTYIGTLDNKTLKFTEVP